MNYVETKESDLTFESISTKEYYPKELDDSIIKANVLLVPFENFRSGYNALFPENTKELFDYLKDNENDKLKVEIIANDDTFKEIELHDATILITSFLVTSIIAPFVINLISNFVYDKIKSREKKAKDVQVKMDVYYQKKRNEKSIKITYDGPADKMEEIITKTIENLDK
jgi:hypothetical protein